jgi:hypothetical protein
MAVARIERLAITLSDGHTTQSYPRHSDFRIPVA